MALKEKILDRAQKFIQKGALDKALIEYKAASDVDPRDIAIRLRIGDLYVKLNKRAEAIKEYTEVAKANSQRGFYLKAIAVYKQVLKLDESSLEVHYKLAELYTKQRLIADAIGSYSTIVSSFEKKGKTSEVMELLKKMAEIDPENIGVRLKLADLYQKLSFEKDALAEYSVIFSRLVARGQFDKAERIFLNIYNSKPREPEVLKGLSDLYRKKGDDQQYLRFAKNLFYHYRDSGDVPAAKGVADSILEARPDENECLRFIKSISRPEILRPEPKTPEPQPVAAEPQAEEPLIEFPASEGETLSPEAVPEAPEEKGAAPVEEEKPLISWPEEEIEITIEGFEEERPEAAAKEAAPAASTAPAKEESLGEIEIEVEEEPSVAPAVETAPPEAEEGPKEPLSGAVSEPETEIEVEAEAGEEAAEAIESLEAVPAQATESEVTASVEASAEISEAKAEEPPSVEFREEEGPSASEEPLMESEPSDAKAEEPPVVEFRAEEGTSATEEPLMETREGAGAAPPVDVTEAEEEPLIEFRDTVPVAGAEEAVAIAEEAAPEEKAEEPLIDIGEEELSERLKDEETAPEAEAHVEEAAGPEAVIEEERAAVEAEPPVEIDEEPAAAEPLPVEAATEVPPVETVQVEAVQVEAVQVEAVQVEAVQVEAVQVEAVQVEAVQKDEAVHEEPLEAAEEVGEEAEAAYDAPADEDLSDAISELMEKIEGAEAESSPTAKIEVDEKVEAEEKIFPEVRFADSGERITEESHPEGKDGYVDLSAELGMEEALEDLAGSWGGGGAEPQEAFDEFKKGIGKQLSREDSETHYNLGIAYMEMELYNEASKEFKIALKDPRLEFDCYIRLGLCSMADSNPDEAIIYYIKGLKIEGKTDEERKGMMYELALAYEAAGDGEEAAHLFGAIYETDPSFREVSAKVAGAGAPFVPLDDGLIEVELL